MTFDEHVQRVLQDAMADELSTALDSKAWCVLTVLDPDAADREYQVSGPFPDVITAQEFIRERNFDDITSTLKKLYLPLPLFRPDGEHYDKELH